MRSPRCAGPIRLVRRAATSADRGKEVRPGRQPRHRRRGHPLLDASVDRAPARQQRADDGVPDVVTPAAVKGRVDRCVVSHAVVVATGVPLAAGARSSGSPSATAGTAHSCARSRRQKAACASWQNPELCPPAHRARTGPRPAPGPGRPRRSVRRLAAALRSGAGRPGAKRGGPARLERPRPAPQAEQLR